MQSGSRRNTEREYTFCLTKENHMGGTNPTANGMHHRHRCVLVQHSLIQKLWLMDDNDTTHLCIKHEEPATTAYGKFSRARWEIVREMANVLRHCDDKRYDRTICKKGVRITVSGKYEGVFESDGNDATWYFQSVDRCGRQHLVRSPLPRAPRLGGARGGTRTPCEPRSLTP